MVLFFFLKKVTVKSQVRILPVSSPVLYQEICWSLLYLSDPILNRSRGSSPPTFFSQTHPIIPVSNTSRLSLGTHRLSQPGNQVNQLKTFAPPTQIQSPVLALALQQNTSCSFPFPLPTSPVEPTGHPLQTSLYLLVTLSQPSTPAGTAC